MVHETIPLGGGVGRQYSLLLLTTSLMQCVQFEEHASNPAKKFVLASIGDKRYEDYNTHGDSKRRRLYKLRHEKHRHKVGTAAYYADRILW